MFDIRIDQQYEGKSQFNLEFLQPYFRDPHNIKLYGLNSGIVYDSHADDVFNNLKAEYMKGEASQVEYLLGKSIPVLIYQGQDNFIVQTPGTMKWVDRLKYEKSEDFRKALFKGWKIRDRIVGSVKSAGLLQLRIVNNAGHRVPMDAPEASLDLASSFV